MKIFNLIRLCLIIIISSNLSLHAQNINEEIESLEKDFKAFKYKRVIEKGNFLLSDAFTTKEDSLNIYHYMLSSAYALNDTSRAKNVIKQILLCKPSFSLNPINTSPKIIELFNYIKEQQQAKQQIDSLMSRELFNQIEHLKNVIKPPYALSSMVFPGSGHLLMGHKQKGCILSSISTILLGGTIYTAIKTNDYRKDYMDARGSADYNDLYDKYNSTYKLRNALFIGYGLFSLYTLYDLHNLNNISITVSRKKEALSINFIKTW
jgi:hypothetical protein